MAEIDPNIAKIHAIVAKTDSIRRRYVLILALAALAVTGVAVAVTATADEPIAFVGAAVAVGVMTWQMSRHLRQKLTTQIMPIIADIIGPFDYQRGGNRIADLQAEGLLPAGSAKRTEDRITGAIGTASFTSWEAEITRRSGDRSRLVWQGLLVDVPVKDRKWMLVRPTPGYFFGGMWRDAFGGVEITGAIKASITVDGKGFEFWCVPGEWDVPALSQRLTDIAQAVPGKVTFYGALQNNRRTVLCFEARHDLYDIGGLFMTKDKVVEQIDRAFLDAGLAPSVAAMWSEGARS